MRRQNLSVQPRPSLAELCALGKSLRKKCPRSSHELWKAPNNRPDPLRLLEESNQGRVNNLIPIRYGRLVNGLNVDAILPEAQLVKIAREGR